MNPLHHPEEALLVDYAAGNLSRPVSAVVATHLPLCAACDETVALCEALGGAFLDLPSENTAVAGADGVLDKLSEIPAATGPRELSEHPIFPDPLLAWMPAGPSALRWWPAMPGLRLTRLRLGSSGEAVWLLRMKANASLPRHAHAGFEALCVLDGQFTDSTGHYQRGDFAAFGNDIEHRAMAGRDGCTCVLALDGPLLFPGPIGWIAKFFYSRNMS